MASEQLKDVNELVKERLKKLEALKEEGINPYPYTYERTHYSNEVLCEFDKLGDDDRSSKPVKVCGRIMAMRNMGKIAFGHLQDYKGRIQVFFKKDVLGDSMKLLKKLDIGDFIGCEGIVFRTKTKELTVEVTSFEILSKAIRPLPEKYHGLKDKEIRYRKRYLDLIMNPEVIQDFKKITLIYDTMRSVLNKRDFLEAHTPILNSIYGGANARPFKSHLNALDMDVYMRISNELFLKRLIIGGMEKVYEFSRDFRNEGIDTTHNPEFTQIEIYEAYTDLNGMMNITEDLFIACCQALCGSNKAQWGDHSIEFNKPFPRMTMEQALKEFAKIDVSKLSDKELFDLRITYNIEVTGDLSRGLMIQQLFEELVEDKLIQPVFIVEHPKETTPLAKKSRINPETHVERFELFMGGFEFANAYSELNDPIHQRKLLEDQAKQLRKGDDEAHPMDEDFVESMEYGMPPTGGVGIGIDRMAMILLNKQSIRDVILFPFMKKLE